MGGRRRKPQRRLRFIAGAAAAGALVVADAAGASAESRTHTAQHEFTFGIDGRYSCTVLVSSTVDLERHEAQSSTSIIDGDEYCFDPWYHAVYVRASYTNLAGERETVTARADSGEDVALMVTDVASGYSAEHTVVLEACRCDATYTTSPK